MVLLAPAEPPAGWSQVVADSVLRETLLEGVQKLRGRVYLRDGAVRPEQLTEDGRHAQDADKAAWHVVTLDECGSVVACARYLAYDRSVSYQDLIVARSALAACPINGQALREAVETELALAPSRGCTFVELGGWALSEKLWCTSEAIRIVIASYGLGRVLGGAIGLSTVTTRHHSSSILRRFGGRTLESPADGRALPVYYDPQYRCEMEILRFDSWNPNPRYAKWVEESRVALSATPVICPGVGGTAIQLASLHRALQEAPPPAVASLTAS